MTEITKTILDENENLFHYEATREVKAIGSGGHITLPIGLIGKRVRVIYTTKFMEEKQ